MSQRAAHLCKVSIRSGRAVLPMRIVRIIRVTEPSPRLKVHEMFFDAVVAEVVERLYKAPPHSPHVAPDVASSTRDNI